MEVYQPTIAASHSTHKPSSFKQHIYYLRVSVGQEYRHDLAGSPASWFREAAILVSSLDNSVDW